MKDKVVLIASMPWPTYNIPSIQVATLKAYLEKHGVSCIGAHWYIRICEHIGYKLYTEISSGNPEGGEAIYSWLYYPENRKNIENRNELIRKILKQDPAFFTHFENLHREILDEYDWKTIQLAGFSLNFSQTMASIYMAREIKKRNPACEIIIGGAEGTAELGASILKEFNHIDFACNGEGESVLLNLAQRSGKGFKSYTGIQGLIFKDQKGTVTISKPDQMPGMDWLPVPDFDDYFHYLEHHSDLSYHDLSVVIPIESSRGCYYECSFCSLNIQWVNTRSQTPEWICHAMIEQSNKYKILDFFFVDNITPLNVQKIFSKVSTLNRDFRFFYEMRANISWEALTCLHEAGLKRVQIGIEAMSSSLLKKFNKKCSVIHNIQGLKNCEELGIIVSSNFIINHPCTSESDIKETLENNKYCFHLRPPSAFSEFGLMFGSPDYNNPKEEFTVLGNHRDYENIYPAEVLERLNLPVKDYTMHSKRVSWTKIKEQVDGWKKVYFEKTEPLLALQDGGSFLKIEDRRYNGYDVYILDETERELYLFLHQTKPITKIYHKFQHVSTQRIDEILKELCSLYLIFSEDDKFLSLAIGAPNRKQAVSL